MQYFNGKEDLFYSKLHKDGKSCLLIFKDGFKLEIIEKEKSLSTNRNSCGLTISAGGFKEVDRITKMLVKDGFKLIYGVSTVYDGYLYSIVQGVEDIRITIRL